MRESLVELGSSLRIEETKENLKDLEAQTQAPDFWNSAEKSSKVLQVIKQGQDKVANYEKLCARLEDAIALAEMAIEENDDSFVEEVQTELAEITDEEGKRVTLTHVLRKIKRLILINKRRLSLILIFHPCIVT